MRIREKRNVGKTGGGAGRIAAGLALLTVIALLAPVSSTAASNSVIDEQVTFSVTNSNATQVPCTTDGQSYTMRGTIVGPSAVLSAASAPVAEVYLHDFGVDGAFDRRGAQGGFWNFKAVPGYDYAAQMAGEGYVSVVLNELGYAPSGQPAGDSSCVGGQASILHQVIAELQSGRYAVSPAGHPVAFKEIITLGESIGAEIAQVEAYTFKDVGALGVIGYSDGGSSQQADEQSLISGQVCATGGQQADGSTGPSGYAYYAQSDSDWQAGFFNTANADPAVVTVASELHVRGPCGDLSSIVPAIFLDQAMDGQITVPVLLVYGDKDSSYPSSAAQQQAGLYSSSPEVTTDVIHNAGHAFTLEYTAPAFRADVADWLARHTPSNPTTPPPPTEPKPKPRGPLLVLGQRAVTITSSNRRVRVSVRCNAPSGASCVGVLTTYALYWRRHVLKGERRLQPRLLGRVSFRVRGGTESTVTIAIAPRTYRALATLHDGVVATAVGRAHVGPGTTEEARSFFRLRARPSSW